jgi:uncharacterized membrane protein YuzA (DUF378 family)
MKHFDCLLKYIIINLLIIAGLVLGLFGLTGTNFINSLSNFVGVPGLDRVIYTIIGASALIFAFRFYKQSLVLPFLDETLIPTTLFTDESFPDNWNIEYTLKAPKGATHVVYWADNGKGRITIDIGPEERKQWNKIYRSWDKMAPSDNNGVAKVDFKGESTLKFRKPDNTNGRICYRWTLGPNKLSKVYCEILD